MLLLGEIVVETMMDIEIHEMVPLLKERDIEGVGM